MRNLPKFLLAAGIAFAAALPSAPAMADPPPWAPAHAYRAKHNYIYYPAYQVYYAPQTQLWFWLDGGRWRTGVSLPTGIVLGGVPGVSIVLDTGRPYERHAYVIENYGERGRHGKRGHRHDD